MKKPFSELSTFGFTPLAINCYVVLYQHGAATAKQLATRLGRRASNLYVVLEQLESAGFVASIKTDWGPIYYHAVAVEEALDHYFAYQKQQVLPIIRAQRLNRPLPPVYESNV